MAITYRYISADSHFEVPVDRWTERVPAQYRERAPRRIKLPHGGDGFLVEGQRISYGGTGHYAGLTPEEFDPVIVDYDKSAGSGPPEQRLREQDADGIDAEVLFAGGGIHSIRAVADKPTRLAVLRAFNDYFAEYCSVAPDRLLGGVLPNRGAADDVAEMEHCAKIGLKAVVLARGEE